MQSSVAVSSSPRASSAALSVSSRRTPPGDGEPAVERGRGWSETHDVDGEVVAGERAGVVGAGEAPLGARQPERALERALHAPGDERAGADGGRGEELAAVGEIAAPRALGTRERVGEHERGERAAERAVPDQDAVGRAPHEPSRPRRPRAPSEPQLPRQRAHSPGAPANHVARPVATPAATSSARLQSVPRGVTPLRIARRQARTGDVEKGAMDWLANVFSAWALAAVVLVCGVACLARARAIEAERAPWTLIGVGLVLYAAGSVVYNVDLTADAEVSFPSLADALWLSLYAAQLRRDGRAGAGAARAREQQPLARRPDRRLRRGRRRGGLPAPAGLRAHGRRRLGRRRRASRTRCATSS